MPGELEELLRDIRYSISLNDKGAQIFQDVIIEARKRPDLYMESLSELKDAVAGSLGKRLDVIPVPMEANIRLFNVVCALKEIGATELLEGVKPEWIPPVVNMISDHEPEEGWAYNIAYFLSGIVNYNKLAAAFAGTYYKLEDRKKELMREFYEQENIVEKKSARSRAEGDKLFTEKMKTLLKLSNPGNPKPEKPKGKRESLWLLGRLWRRAFHHS